MTLIDRRSTRAASGGECRPHNSDLRVRTPTGLTTYPDVTVIRGPREIHGIDPLAITNPALIVEKMVGERPSFAKVRFARRHLGAERQGHTLQPTALVNEAYLQLRGLGGVPWHDRTHFSL